jgi:plastocyanin
MMKKVAIVLNIVVLSIIFSFYGCGIADQTNSDSSTTPSPGATTHIVEMTGNYEFVPSSLTIKQGDSVKWVLIEKDHEVASGTVIETTDGREGVPDGLWNSGTLARGITKESFTYTFNSTGTFPYYCESHVDQGMIGSITVE